MTKGRLLPAVVPRNDFLPYGRKWQKMKKWNYR
jgi:hypothetical protein